jgi:hypothetical protein
VVFFRHLPALDGDADALLMTGHGLLARKRVVCAFLFDLGTGTIGTCARSQPFGLSGAALGQPAVDLTDSKNDNWWQLCVAVEQVTYFKSWPE